MNKFPTNIKRWELERSRTATINDIDNTLPERLLDNALDLAQFLQTLRDRLCERYAADKAVLITSGYRSPELNAKVGGSKTSAHMQALAADIKVAGITSRDLALFIRDEMSDVGYDQVINEYGQWVHVGLKPRGVKPRLQNLAAIRVNGKTQYRMLG